MDSPLRVKRPMDTEKLIKSESGQSEALSGHDGLTPDFIDDSDSSLFGRRTEIKAPKRSDLVKRNPNRNPFIENASDDEDVSDVNGRSLNTFDSQFIGAEPPENQKASRGPNFNLDAVLQQSQKAQKAAQSAAVSSIRGLVSGAKKVSTNLKNASGKSLRNRKFPTSSSSPDSNNSDTNTLTSNTELNVRSRQPERPDFIAKKPLAFCEDPDIDTIPNTSSYGAGNNFLASRVGGGPCCGSDNDSENEFQGIF